MLRHVRLTFSFALLALLSLCASGVYADLPDDRVIIVNPTDVDELADPPRFGSIQDAIDSIHDVDDAYTQIEILPSEDPYVENIQLELPRSTANLEFRNSDLLEKNPNGRILRGLQIIGDNRPYFPQYINGYEHCASSDQSGTYLLTTSEGLPGEPYAVLVAGFGPTPTTVVGPVGVQESDPYLGFGGAPDEINNDFDGDLALIGRGTIGFVTKTLNAQEKGASVVLIQDNQEVGTVALGGSDPGLTIPTFSISKDGGDDLLAALALNANMTITISPPSTFYDPPIGTNFATVELSHPGGDRSMIEVTLSGPIPEVDPYLVRGATPVLEQPVFEDFRLGFSTVDAPRDIEFPIGSGDTITLPADKIVLSDAAIADAEGNFIQNITRQAFTIKSLSGNVIELTEEVPADLDITRTGSLLQFMPAVRVQPAVKREPIVRAQNCGFSMSGLWLDFNPDFDFAELSYGMVLSGCASYLSNIMVTDLLDLSANGGAFTIANQSRVDIVDGWRDEGGNRRLASIGWSQGVSVSSASRLEGAHVTCHNMTNANGYSVSSGGTSNLDTLCVIGNYGLFQEGSTGANIGTFGGLSCDVLMIVSDIFGSGIQAGGVTCGAFRLERIYKSGRGVVQDNALQISAGGLFQVDPFQLYLEEGTPTFSVRTSSIIKDCFDVFPGFTQPNVGIFCDDSSRFISYKELEFSGNDVDMLSVQDNQFITPGWEMTPHNVYQVTESGKMNSVYQLQELVEEELTLTLDPGELFQTQGVYCDFDQPGKTFTIFSSTPTWHYIQLKSGSFVGNKYKWIRLHPVAGASVTLKMIDQDRVLVTGMYEADFFYK